MNDFVTIWQWWLQSFLSTTLVLVCAVVVAAMFRQPARRKRIMELALLGCLVAVVLAALPGVPRWSLFEWFGDSAAAPAAALLRRLSSGAKPPVANTDGSIEQATEVVEPMADTPENAELLAAWRETSEQLRSSGDPATVALADSPALAVGASLLGLLTLSLYALGVVMMNVYALGVLLMSLWWLCGLAAVWRVVYTAKPATANEQNLLAQVVAASPWPTRHTNVRLLLSDRTRQPFTFTWLRSTIVLPSSLAQGDSRRLRWSLAHEWAHVAAGDARWWSLSGLLRIVLFYQPLIYWLRRELRRSQDYLADANAKGEAEAADYAEFLTQFVSRMAAPAVPATVLGIGGRRSELHRRVTMLVAPRRPLEQRCPRRWSIGAALIAACLAALAVTVSAGHRPAQAIELADAEESAAPAAAPIAVPDKPQDATLAEQLDVRAGLDWLGKRQAADAAAKKGVGYLRAQQNRDGSWAELPGNEGGVTSLATMALIAAGVPADDPQLQLALVRVRGIEPKSTYLVSLQTLALCAARLQLADASQIERNVAWLENSQHRDENGVGGWSYQGGAARVDGSNSFYAVAALDAAARSGVAVKQETWQAIVDYCLIRQTPSGGWPYTEAGPSTPTMTAAGVASLCIAAGHLAKDDESDETHARRAAAVSKGIAWLAKNWTTASPARVKNWQFYYLYTLVAAGSASGQASFGDKSWSNDGIDLLVSHQSATGSWSGSATEQNSALATSFAVIFLCVEKETAAKLAAGVPKAAKAAAIAPLDVLRIDAVGTLEGQDIHGDYIVEPSGEVALGPAYGRVDVQGLSYRESETAIVKHLKKMLRDPHVSVTLGGWKNSPRKEFQPGKRRIAPLDAIRIEVIGTFLGQDIIGDYIVEPGGEVALGPEYGRVNLGGTTYREAEEAITRQLKTMLKNPEVSVTLGAWKNGQTDDVRIRKLETEIRTLRSTIDALQSKPADAENPDSKKLLDAVKSLESQR